MPTWIWLIFVTVVGGCVGSFLNVVIYRLPEGQSLVSPSSRCPKCGHELSWFENIPIFSWLVLGGRCRKCKASISFQYPLVEIIGALLFGGLFVIYYYTNMRPEFHPVNLGATAPAFAVQLVLLAGLLAATVIDGRLFIIPISIPWAITLAALVVLPAAGGLGILPESLSHSITSQQIVPVVEGRGIAIAAGGAIGLLVALVLVWAKVLPRSFDQELENLEGTCNPQTFLEYPHPRREILKELVFVIFPLIGMIAGAYLFWPDYSSAVNSYNSAAAGSLGISSATGPGLYWRVLGGVFCGYLMGGGLVWATRILGTLGFGKEAMGLGDVHLLAAIGAVLGPVDVIYVFFIAPFFGILAVLVMAGVVALLKERQKMIPYGPYLAGAALVVMIFRQPLMVMFNIG